MFTEASINDINLVLEAAWHAFRQYKQLPLRRRAGFMRQVAEELVSRRQALIAMATQETNLPAPRLETELDRTIFQLNSYADFCESGQWMDIRIDTADATRIPPKPDIRKMLVPLGPVVVFGASNFPFAYSTAGGDTACAFAAGCPVIVKAHPAHAQTSELVASAILQAAVKQGMPDGIFAHVHGASPATGEALVKHQYTAAVGFTGSLAGGRQLFDWGNARDIPIPVFAEMGSINPVFLLPEKLHADPAEIARLLGDSITLSVGQFCTNPGVIIALEGEDLQLFIKALEANTNKVPPAAMLSTGICKNYTDKSMAALSQDNVQALLPKDIADAQGLRAAPMIASTTAADFISNKLLQQEVFGPYSLIVRCRDMAEMLQLALQLSGQLTSTLLATEQDIINNELLVEAIRNICGRIVLNGVPTGVEVCLAMQHGGPYPATTDSRFTSVGADGIKRFARPVSYQNWPDNLLPDELKEGNPIRIWRITNGKQGV